MGLLTSLAIGVGAIIIMGWLSKATKAGAGLGELASGVRSIIEEPLAGFGAGVSAALSPTIAPTIAPAWAPTGFEWVGDIAKYFMPSLRDEDRTTSNGGIVPPSNGTTNGGPKLTPLRTEDRTSTLYTAGKKALAEATAPRTEDRVSTGLRLYKA